MRIFVLRMWELEGTALAKPKASPGTGVYLGVLPLPLPLLLPFLDFLLAFLFAFLLWVVAVAVSAFIPGGRGCGFNFFSPPVV